MHIRIGFMSLSGSKEVKHPWNLEAEGPVACQQEVAA